jgi:hypothetical protein
VSSTLSTVKHDAAKAQRVRRCDGGLDLDQLWIAKLRQLKPPVPIRSPHHHDIDLDAFERIDAVHPRAFDRRLTLCSKPSSVKKAIAASRSSTTTLTWSILLIAMSAVWDRRSTTVEVGCSRGYRTSTSESAECPNNIRAAAVVPETSARDDGNASRFNVAMTIFRVSMLLAFALTPLLGPHALAHPGSGIVVDSQGQVYFQDSPARTVWRIDGEGRTTAYSDKIGGHWMTLDERDEFALLTSELVERIAPSPGGPALLIADGGAPIAVRRGSLFYGLRATARAGAEVGLTRISPPDHREPFAPKLGPAIESLGITGLTFAEGKLYVACLTDVMVVNADGTFAKLISRVTIPGCDSDAPTCFLRGLAVDANGDCYVAATGCRRVIRLTTEALSKR